HLVAFVAQALAKRAGDLERLAEKHHARVGRPPQHRLAARIPRKDAAPVSREQALEREIAARAEQAVRLRQRTLDRGNWIVASETVYHVTAAQHATVGLSLVLLLAVVLQRLDDAEAVHGLLRPAAVLHCEPDLERPEEFP